MLHQTNRLLLLMESLIVFTTILGAFWRNLISRLFVLIMLGTILKKYEIDITSILNQEFDELEKMKFSKSSD
ncbi:hypothetical protein [Lactococcus allomyrinae]|uniref:Uncharacterized protein n=1 Tax=Lactococcus allomyrinae TaxID=2419773 RepID=A0A387B989_9LACT|nr:hypothetical protein [Lactococcus allomyrinae]AYG00395.1 hypothetical protein D7I46_04385 [Lactococcus allomyrinae]